MTAKNIRQHLQEQIDSLPDDMVQQIADFTHFVMARRKITPCADWEHNQWQAFALSQFFREDDEVEYTLADAKEIYNL